MANKKGYIYILTNPSFPDYVKIGFATNIENRLRQLNRSETIPYAFRVYAVYKTSQSLTDKKVHEIIDGLNPDLRTIETFDGKKRVKEFYAMQPEEAYNLLDCIATISGTKECLKRMKPEGHEILDEEMAEEVSAESKKPAFKFSMIDMKPGTVITYRDGKTKAKVINDSKIELNGETMSLSRACQVIDNNDDRSYQGPIYWYYKGKSLSDLRHETEK